VLVLKDDASKYVWLRAAVTADSDTVIEVLLEWFAAFGVAYVWVSDQGSHFKNHVVRGLQHALGAHHHFVTAHCPWANGTVEVANRCILRVFRSLLSEWRLAVDQWKRLVPLVQLVVNQTKRESLGGVAPVTGMTGVPAMSPVAPIVCEPALLPATLDEVRAIQQANVPQLVHALDEMHKRMEGTAKKARGRKKAGVGVRAANFERGDYVLLSCQSEVGRPKLQVIWKGPCRVSSVVSDWVFEVEDLTTGRVTVAHASRLKFYADSALGNLKEAKLQAEHSAMQHEVQSLNAIRFNSELLRWEVQVAWLGLELEESTWEPAANVLEDVPAIFKKFVARSLKTANTKHDVVAMCSSLELDIESFRGGSVAAAAPEPIITG
jgi:hypothetical protein